MQGHSTVRTAGPGPGYFVAKFVEVRATTETEVITDEGSVWFVSVGS